MPNPDFYVGREQTLVKHYILEQYLEKFAHKIGWFWQTLAYVDCFSGPWESRDPELSDTSFAIVVNAFRSAKAHLAEHGKTPRVRCLFLEKDNVAFSRLSSFTDSIHDLEAIALPGELETKIPEILKFVHDSGPDKSFGEDIRHELEGLDSQQREERLVGAYMRRIKQRGQFTYVGSAIVWKPEIETTHFHLIYATRKDPGIEVFKEVEEKAMDVATSARASAKERKRFERSGQFGLFEPEQRHPSIAMDDLRQRYLHMARERIETLLQSKLEVTYRRLWRRAVAFPLVWENDLREWIAEWRANNLVELPELSARQKPSRERDDRVVWRGVR